MPKFNARDFLKAPPTIKKSLDLPHQLRTDPQRLRQEFVAIATDPKERFDFRTQALIVLSRHPRELDACDSPETTKALITAFREEFTSEKLRNIKETMRGEECTPEGLIAHLFCIVFATLSPENTQESINAVRTALKGTSLDAVLTKHLDTIKRKRVTH